MDRQLRVFSTIKALQADFPGFVIWGETVRGRYAYVAQALDGGTNPRVVTSASLDRLRAQLEEPLASSDPGQPNVARIYDYLLGGSTNFAADRDEAARLLAADPRLPELARQNRAFLASAVTHVARQGVAQFIDVGAGLPTSPSTHAAAGAVLPGARVAYVDHDPVVIAHTRGLTPLSARVVALPGDLRDPEALVRDPALTSLIDLTKPVCVLLVAVLHFLDTPTARRVTAALTGAMVPGSYLVLSVGQAAAENAASLYRAYTAARLHHHRRADIEGFFAGLDLLPPGLTDACTWPRPAGPGDIDRAGTAGHATVLCGVGRKPVRWAATATARSAAAGRSTTPAP
ncbi:MAG: SAM-dependent methyltransferase [Streptosporangiaceae bacterium]